MPSDRAPLSERVYSALVTLYPGDFRREFGDQIHRHFSDEWRDERERGGWLLLLWLRISFDFLTSLSREWCSDILPDIHYGFRRLRAHPVTTLAALLTIALTIGGSSTIFSFVDSALLQALPFPDADQLVRLTTADRTYGTERATPAEFRMWQQQVGLFSKTAAYVTEFVNLTSTNQSSRVNCASVTSDFFQLFGIQPAFGRTLPVDDRRQNLERVVVLSHKVWQQQFAGDPGVVGKTVVIDDRSFAVVGILPAGFRFLNQDVDIWRPLDLDESRRGALILPEVFARLASGVTRYAVEARLGVLQRQLAELEPMTRDRDSKVTPLRDVLIAPVRSSLLMLMACAILALFIAVFNLCSLQQSHNAGRRREFAIRISLGASRQRLLRQFLAESWLLSGLGGLSGIALTVFAIPVLWAYGPATLTRFQQPVVNLHLILFTAIITIAFGTLTGLLPAVFLIRQAQGTALARALRGWTFPVFGASTGSLGRAGLVVAQIGLALALVLTTGLLVRSYANLYTVDTGFDAHGLATVSVLMGPEYREIEKQLSGDRHLLQRLGSLPGVSDAALTTWLPLTDSAHWWRVSFPSRQMYSKTDARAGQSAVSPDYFKVMRTRLIEGREFSSMDTVDSTPVVIVNETMARRYFGSESPIGRRIRLGEEGMPWLTIVGVVASTRHLALDMPPSSETYVPFTQYRYLRLTHFVLRSQGNPRALLPEMISAIHSVGKTMAVLSPGTMQERFSAALEPRQFETVLVAAFGILALLLTTVGVYGVLSRNVASRQHEIAVRMAVGASPAEIARLVFVQGAAMTAGGSVIGIVIAGIAARYLRTILYGVTLFDPVTYCCSYLLVFGLAAIACSGPAKRAALTDPARLFRDSV